MHDPRHIAEAYLAAWNETDATARQGRIATAFTERVSYVDPLASISGAAHMDALIGGVQQRFPGFVFKLKGTPDGHGTHVRFSWELGPEGAEAPIEGTDVAVVENGRIAAVIGFLDKVPAHAG